MTAVVTGDSGGAGWWFRIPIDGEGQGRRKRKRFTVSVKEKSVFLFSYFPCVFFFTSICYLGLHVTTAPPILTTKKKKKWGPKILGALICSTVCTPPKPGLTMESVSLWCVALDPGNSPVICGRKKGVIFLGLSCDF